MLSGLPDINYEAGPQTDRLTAYNEGFHDGYNQAMSEMPEIVRCKDCKHFDGLDCKVNDIVNIMDTNWYCADGEVKH